MITIIFGPPRAGKTALMVKLLNDVAFDYERTRKMQKVLREKNEKDGWNLTIPKHCVSANFDIKFRKEFFLPRHARVIDPNHLGFANDKVKTHFILPYECFGIQEAQGYYNSRNFANFPEWKSNLFEQHGHNHLDFFLDTQRPGLIDVNIRELSNFIEIRNLDIKKDKFGFITGLKWTVREFNNSGAVDEYMKSSKRDKSLYVTKNILYDRDVFAQYKSTSLETKFYEGHENTDFDLYYSTQYLKDSKLYA